MQQHEKNFKICQGEKPRQTNIYCIKLWQKILEDENSSRLANGFLGFVWDEVGVGKFWD